MKKIEPAYIYSGIVSRVIDGDTFEIDTFLGFDISIKTKYRLNGIDTPETRTRNKVEKLHGLEAKQFVVDAIEGKSVIVKSVKRGKYRFVCYVYYTNTVGKQVSLTDELIANGFEKKLKYA